MKTRPLKYNKKYYETHKEQEKARTKAWRLAHPEWYKNWAEKNKEKRRAASRLHEYGLKHEDFLKMLKKQKGICPICLRKMKRIDVDHDHKTEKVRGLLCHGCNTLIGLAQDSAKVLQRAIGYLQKD